MKMKHLPIIKMWRRPGMSAAVHILLLFHSSGRRNPGDFSCRCSRQDNTAVMAAGAAGLRVYKLSERRHRQTEIRTNRQAVCGRSSSQISNLPHRRWNQWVAGCCSTVRPLDVASSHCVAVAFWWSSENSKNSLMTNWVLRMMPLSFFFSWTPCCLEVLRSQI